MTDNSWNNFFSRRNSFRDIIRIEDKEEWIVLNDKNGRCLPMPKQGIENIKVLDILTNKEGLKNLKQLDIFGGEIDVKEINKETKN